LFIGVLRQLLGVVVIGGLLLLGEVRPLVLGKHVQKYGDRAAPVKDDGAEPTSATPPLARDALLDQMASEGPVDLVALGAGYGLP
jgi:hypothetical protein